MFKPADHSRRTPAWLQKHTKENIIWQFAMVVLLLVGFSTKDWYDERKVRRERDKFAQQNKK